VVGITLGALVLNEPVDARLLIGTGLVIGGIALVNSRYGAKPLFQRGPANVEPAKPR
jgi:drug/metabolite transporter (DMT)-like permease